VSAAPKTRPDAAAQFRVRGYVLSENDEFALRDLANGLDAIASLCDERTGDMPELPPSHWAGLLRTFSRTATRIAISAPFANNAMAQAREDDSV